ncbi:MAG: relaxase/mobilization nuclease domain-containing protein [Clostridiaceae bacterium]|nr:relaxase/mobilization nuclease domain-containing protein [Clostridiaceae bacterium]
MPYIKFINEDNHTLYDTEDSVYCLISYIYNVTKTGYDSVRPGQSLGYYIGCYPFIGDEEQSKDHDEVSKFMVINNRCYRKSSGNLMKHRVISFEMFDYVLPDEAFQLAEYIARAYGERYITAYGVHMDTNNIHIHLAIDTISWKDGKRFNQSYEKNWLWSLVSAWMAKHEKYLSNDIIAQTKYEKYVGLY